MFVVCISVTFSDTLVPAPFVNLVDQTPHFRVGFEPAVELGPILWQVIDSRFPAHVIDEAFGVLDVLFHFKTKTGRSVTVIQKTTADPFKQTIWFHESANRNTVFQSFQIAL
ncbi:MAG TPA: hypothetical protein DCM28_21170 [Phycisphaerales bacterium]|nr:hypothetical protein [Phycisphaerales bacterium]HCD35322.1 hypothetical protein [Phycisphaerales bacterium]|tara:strand:+ start:140 stop:475 length:336 start_codon:yes stop_codon:yes gene_type:complete